MTGIVILDRNKTNNNNNNKTPLYAVHQKHTLKKSIYRLLKVKGWRKIYYANTNQKVKLAILIADKENFRTKEIVKDKEGHHITTEENILQEYIEV